MHSPILAPVVVLVAWSMVMWAWMYVTRIPAIRRAGMTLDPTAPRGEQMATPEGDAGEGERGGGHKFASPEVGTVSGAGGM